MKTIINGITFYNKKSVIDYCKKIMERNINKILTGEDLRFMWDLVILHYPQPECKNLYCANILTIKLSPHTNSTWLWVTDNDGKEHDVSIYKAIDNLEWEEHKLDDNFLTFGKYINQKVEDVIDNDYDYFKWLVSQTWIKDSLKKIIYKELNRIDNENMFRKDGLSEEEIIKKREDWKNFIPKINPTEKDYENLMSPNSSKFPIIYNGHLYYERNCSEDFLAFYEGKFMLSSEGGIYLSDGVYIFPDGSTGEGL